MMNRIKELKYLTLVMLLCSFLAVGTLNSCREQPKEGNTEQQSEVQEEHPEAEEHPAEDMPFEGDEHPESEEHPTDSI